MHRLSELAELDWPNPGNVAILVPESPAEPSETEETETDQPKTRRAYTIDEPTELIGEGFPLVLGDARDPDDEDEEDDLDYLYDDEEEDLDDDLDEDLDEFEDEEEEFEDEDEEL